MDTYSNTRWRENNNDLPSNPKGTNFMDFHDHNVALPVIDSKGKGWQRNRFVCIVKEYLFYKHDYSPLLSSPNGSWPSSPSHHSPDNVSHMITVSSVIIRFRMSLLGKMIPFTLKDEVPGLGQ
jgi:hypothetical protein